MTKAKKFRLLCTTCQETHITRHRRRMCLKATRVPHAMYKRGRIVYCYGRLVAAPKPVKRAPTLDAQIARAETNLKRNLSRLRAAATRVKKFERQVTRLKRLRDLQAVAIPSIMPGHVSTRHARAIELE